MRGRERLRQSAGKGDRVFSLVKAKTGREGLLDVREEPRAAALRRSSDGIPSTERVVSSFFLSAPLSLALLYRRASSLFSYTDSFKPSPPVSLAARPHLSAARVPILAWKDA